MNRWAVLGVVLAVAGGGRGAEEARLPEGVRAVWDQDKAWRETTPTRERVCLNGLWRWQPADSEEAVPAGRWGFFKVPGFWPGQTSYIQEDTQTLYPHPDWKGDGRGTTAAWYQREITVPAEWQGRQIVLQADCVNSLAAVFLDGKRVGELRFPGGEADLTGAVRPGEKHRLSVLVRAAPLKAVMLAHTDSNAAREVKGNVERRGLCGDVFLASRPKGARVTGVQVRTELGERTVKVTVGVERLAKEGPYTLRVQIRDGKESIRSMTGPVERDGRVTLTEGWDPEKLWDLHTPGNVHEVDVILEQGMRVVDVWPAERFGVRELTIRGRDFLLNGTRLALSAVPLDSAQLGARTASLAGARETLLRLKAIGINFVYTHNYGCEPGTHLGFGEVLRAADEVGMLVSFSLPHFSQYEWKDADAERTNGYAAHAAYYVGVAGNHPSVVMYSMSHNATGYDQDMNPDLMGMEGDPRQDGWSKNNAAKAVRAEAVARGLDPGRIVYHHASGNLGAMHPVNFYVNFVPIQEMSDWFEPWAKRGVKPVFLCEYGVPFTWDWTMYRGWYQGKREFGSARVPWEFCSAEWSAQFLGDRAYQVSEAEKRNLRWEAEQFRAGRLWHRWDYPRPVGSSEFADQQEILGRYLTDNMRAHRTWGVSATSPWEYAAFWRRKEGTGRETKKLAVDWDQLQRPGFSADVMPPRQGWMSSDGERDDWIPTAAGEAVLRNNRPLLGYIGGPGERFTDKGHNFAPEETIDKQLVVLNNGREAVTCTCQWSLGLPKPVSGRQEVKVPAGGQARVPVKVALPYDLPRGQYELAATFRFSTGEEQRDTFRMSVLPWPPRGLGLERVALFDPKGESLSILPPRPGVSGFLPQQVKADADLTGYDVLIIGKGALTEDGPIPDVSRVRDGLRVLVLEQSARVLERRLGFRVAEYGLRQVFPRVPYHPVLRGLTEEHLRDWRGEATLVPPRLEFRSKPMYGPTVTWCGLEVPRAWRCGCRGSVASVLIEKPARGDFAAITDGGYALQYSPLVEYHEGRGMVLFCQMDVTGRTETDPAAVMLVENLLHYVMGWRPLVRRRPVVYAGEAAGRKFLDAAGLAVTDYGGGELPAGRLLIAGPGAKVGDVREWLEGGGRLLGLGLSDVEARALVPGVELKRAEHIASFFPPAEETAMLGGVGPADVHNRDPRPLFLAAGGADVAGNGVLATAAEGRAVFCALAPWTFDPAKAMNQKRTFRRTAALVGRLAANLGAQGDVPLLERLRQPAKAGEQRWRDGLYLDVPEEWDDPYRFFRW